MRRLVIGCRKVTFPSREYLGGLLSGVTSKDISYCLNVSMSMEDRCFFISSETTKLRTFARVWEINALHATR